MQIQMHSKPLGNMEYDDYPTHILPQNQRTQLFRVVISLVHIQFCQENIYFTKTWAHSPNVS